MYDKFACAAWSDAGIVFDERDRRKENPGGSVNYWDRWYLGFELGKVNRPDESQRFRKLPSEGQPRTGSYKTLIEGGHDLVELHALMAPRPLLVSGGTADMPERWPASRRDDPPRYARAHGDVERTDLLVFSVVVTGIRGVTPTILSTPGLDSL
jgi:hypothetical protein